ncbi:RNA polymerase I-specific transcription initiation factor rrn11 [Achaetomium macrosporum]|uniref:RNA polymerase I-specific transcription initiation factor rrn11 n=1 Tax=Achaetomium macrosporum TaxID=79813 RepID=A0AAN7C9V9_9PEZI|nr:RNA polymerase I-specific transcription initiation factor rrn11 [Achaetomium macrosporum]
MDGPSKPSHRKRKRAPSDTVINPLSHSPDTLRQFALAGYPADEPLPSKAFPGFPHRPPRHPRKQKNRTSSRRSRRSSSGVTDYQASDADVDTGPEGEAATTDDDDDDDDEPGAESTTSPTRRSDKDDGINRKARAYHARVGWLAAVIRRCLAEGDIPMAKRAFGMLERAKVEGQRVDLRWDRYWEMGAEILMREGEELVVARSGKGNPPERGGVKEEEEEGGEEEGKGEEEKLERLKAYFEYLIREYPFSRHLSASNRQSALEFQVALFSAEMEAAYASHRRGLERLQRGDGWEEEEEAMDIEEPMDYGSNGYVKRDGDGGAQLLPATEDHLWGLSRRELRLREKENDLRLSALQRMTDIARRMDTVMETMPFSRDPELLRLRAMVALYTGDLYVPPAPRSKAEDKESKKARAGQRRKARGFLRRIQEAGGELKDHDEMLLESLASDEEEDDDDEEEASVLPMFSSMGIEEG